MATQKTKRTVPKKGSKSVLPDDGTRVTFTVTFNPQKIARALNSKESTPFLLQIFSLLGEELTKRGVGGKPTAG